MLLLEETQLDRKSLYRFTADQYFELIRTGFIREGSPYELLDGLLLLKDRSERGDDLMSIGRLHNLLIQLLNRLNVELEAYDCHIQTQGPLVLAENQVPEPDGAVINGDAEDYEDNSPCPSDIFCVIEVSDSSLRTDRTTKLRIYAQAGIQQYIIINLADRQVEVYESPVVSAGVYKKKLILKSQDEIALCVGRKKRLPILVSRLLRSRRQ